MTRSIFDPTGPETEHSGSQNLGPDAANSSRMPPSVTDGKVSEEEVRDVTGADVVAPDESATTDAIAEAADAVDAGRAGNLSNPGAEVKT